MSSKEHNIQAAAMKALEHDPRARWLFAVPNGGRRDAVTGKRLKDEGVKPGVWDLEYPVAKGMTRLSFSDDFRGLRIEVKTKNGRLTKEQAEFGIFSDEQGWALSICRSTQEIVDAFISYCEERHPGNEAALKECRKKLGLK